MATNASPTENRQRATMQMPQGLDAKHSDEMFLVTGDPSI
jgi:hypothetical protein